MSTENSREVTTPENHRAENRWVNRFEDLLKVKNFDDLKNELGGIATEIQSEIQSFDINDHLSPSARARLKTLEQSYTDVMKAVNKAQKQFDREFNKTLRVLKTTRQDAEKHLKDIRAKITKHRGTLVKASKGLQDNLTKKAKSAARKVTKKKVKTAKKR